MVSRAAWGVILPVLTFFHNIIHQLFIKDRKEIAVATGRVQKLHYGAV
jgi:hypothetical protein